MEAKEFRSTSGLDWWLNSEVCGNVWGEHENTGSVGAMRLLVEYSWEDSILSGTPRFLRKRQIVIAGSKCDSHGIARFIGPCHGMFWINLCYKLLENQGRLERYTLRNSQVSHCPSCHQVFPYGPTRHRGWPHALRRSGQIYKDSKFWLGAHYRY